MFVRYAEQAENAALGEQSDFSFIQLLCFQAIFLYFKVTDRIKPDLQTQSFKMI